MPKCFEEDEIKLALNGLLDNANFHMSPLLVDPYIKQSYQNDYLFLAKCLKKQYEDGVITKDKLVNLVKLECQSLREQWSHLSRYKMLKEAGVEYMPFSLLLKYPITQTVFSMTNELWCDPTIKPLPMPSLDGLLNGEKRDKGRSDCIVEGDKQAYKLYYYFAQDTSKSSIPMTNKPSLTSMFGYGAYQPQSPTHKPRNMDIESLVSDNIKKLSQIADDKQLRHGVNCSCKVSIDHEFIGLLEGSTKHGYVPNPETSQSGVTIATGFDLGARNIKDLMALGFSDSLINKLSPYLGLKKYDAKSFLNDFPLSINDEELSVITKAVKESENNKIISLYNKNSKVEFKCLPAQAQTVIASVAYQYGYLPTKAENFWKQAITQDWEGMYKNLMKFGDLYVTRRHAEAKLIKEILNDKTK